MALVGMRQLLDAGMHFGHQTRRWNPKMRPYIHGDFNGIYLIDLVQSQRLIEDAYNFVGNVAARGGTILFVGTKKQAQDAIAENAGSVNMPYVKNRWLPGLLTNWKTISSRLERYDELRRQKEEGQLELLGTKERQVRLHELEKLDESLGGVAGMQRLPDAVVVIDLKVEALAVKEARRCGIPVVGLVDTNCDPNDADYVVPGNDDAIRSCGLFLETLARGIGEAKATDTSAAAAAFEDVVEAEAEPVGASSSSAS